jgi:diadenylate cyclase
VLRGDRIVAAACTLPLSEARLPQQLGTRHRAALGISERTDAVAVVVSEETGEIAVAADGRLIPRLDSDGLRRTLHALVGLAANGHIVNNDRRNGPEAVA